MTLEPKKLFKVLEDLTRQKLVTSHFLNVDNPIIDRVEVSKNEFSNEDSLPLSEVQKLFASGTGIRVDNVHFESKQTRTKPSFLHTEICDPE
jgi:hypothetical protein